MRGIKAYFGLIILLVISASCSKNEDPPVETEPEDELVKYDPVAVDKSNPMKIYVHYMPWFESPETNNGSWGQHWTMSNSDPNTTDDQGKRDIASYFYPLIGPYASSNKNVIEYHLLLMKYAGVDGLIIDWYGSHDVYDFPANKKNAEAVIGNLDEVGLSFALTYEDWTLNPVVEQGKASTVNDAAIADLKYIENNYFNLDSYIEIDGDPLLTVFGPQVIQDPAGWTSVLAEISESPVFLALWYESEDLGSNGSGEFAWVYEDNSHIENFYTFQANKFDVSLGSAYPGFKDYYLEGGWGGSHKDWTIDHSGGATLEETLNMAHNAKTDYLQIATWNDFGEGTMIEPTLEYGYSFLEKLQSFTGTPYSKNELEKIQSLYELRKANENDVDVQKVLDQSFYYFVSLQTDKAIAIVDSLNQIP